MSLLTLQLGQCGNQIGGELFSLLSQDSTKLKPQFFSKIVNKKLCQEYEEESIERFFHVTKDRKLEARAVMIDMEPKVIAQTLADARKSGKWSYPKGQQFCGKRGSGNNWANGFCRHGPKSVEYVLDMVQKEIEKCDRFGGFLNFMSLAGGTGSGVGTYVTECLRDAYPHSFILNQVVWPYGTGEVIVQNYNAVLTLAHLYKASDAVIIFENDKLQSICTQLLNIKHVSFRDINRVICHKLASILQPVKLFTTGTEESMLRKSYSVPNVIGDLVEQLCPHPDYKLLSIRSIPQMAETSLAYSSYTWAGLLKHLRQMLIADASMEEGINWEIKMPLLSNPDLDNCFEKKSQAPRQRTHFNKSISNLVVMRGKDLNTADPSAFQDPQLYVNWIPPSSLSTFWCHPKPYNQYEKTATLLSNSQTPVSPLNSVIDKAWTMFASRAYVHQYIRYGISEDDFVDNFAFLEQVLKNYSSL